MKYEAIEAAREMAEATTKEAMERIARSMLRVKGDPALIPPPGFKYLDTAPFDGTFIRLRCRPGIGRDNRETVGQWRVMPDGFCGWWDRSGFYISPGPLFWAPEHGAIQ